MPYPLLIEKMIIKGYFHGLKLFKKHQNRPENKHKKLSQNVWGYVFKGKGRLTKFLLNWVKRNIVPNMTIDTRMRLLGCLRIDVPNQVNSMIRTTWICF